MSVVAVREECDRQCRDFYIGLGIITVSPSDKELLEIVEAVKSRLEQRSKNGIQTNSNR